MSLPETVETPEEIAIRRAEQNRAAQRAFRQRKQKYIKWLESKAEELDEVYRIMALVRAENQQLCHRVAELEEKLSLSKGSCSSMSASPIATRPGPATERGLKATGDTGVVYGSRGSTTVRNFGTDGSLGREISMRLMNLAMLPSLGGPDSLGQDATLMSRSRSLSSLHDSSSGGVHNTKGKMAFKMSYQSQQQGTLLQAALQPSPLFFGQHQEQHHNNQQQQQQQPQQQEQHQHQQLPQQQQQPPFPMEDMADKSGDRQIGQESGGSWLSYSPSLASASSTSVLAPTTSTPPPGNSCLPNGKSCAGKAM
ncbi:hypothetical protein EC968_002176 [Mortierella alpina]|nr:hypothetical protein EC968_002176 [Mortierella alpina]